MTQTPLRVAMWSGPRNISTAMMRSWENRGDCAVSDEPLYAAYLAATGLDHPGRDEIIAQGECDPARVVAQLLGPVPGGLPVWYQKHMAHHLPAGLALDWVDGLHNVLLIRDPVRVVASYVKSRAEVAPEDLGVLQQMRLLEHLQARHGQVPTIIDSADFLQRPEAHLRALCAHLDLDFRPGMLQWPAGPRASDGVWAPHWYAAVWRSTGFERAADEAPVLTGHAAEVAEACRPAYEQLRALRWRID
ncbi:sulfotransferase-like domain-containing protein [Ideonella alba]|uniref:sulfotransferase-like domain-containing protein n=1 Tax=Ideonella alba TaxID=2824118 RepID=UPI0028730F8F|nr:HAD family hydrolase [Ideonella alba]